MGLVDTAVGEDGYGGVIQPSNPQEIGTPIKRCEERAEFLGQTPVAIKDEIQFGGRIDGASILENQNAVIFQSIH